MALTLPLPHEPETLAVPAQLLTDCSSGSTGEVSLNLERGLIIARLSDRGMPQEREYEPIDLGQLPPMPPQPTEWVENSPKFLEALRQAMASTDPDATRYATGCVQLDGAAGSVRATDGRQALVQTGFQFPGAEPVLIPSSKVFQVATLPHDTTVQIGRTVEQVVLRIGPWTISWVIEPAGRFPDIERIVPAESSIKTRLTFDPADALFLATRLDQLPRDEGLHQAVTVELNGTVAIRARRTDESPPTELVLSRSQRTGREIRFVTDRRLLQRALRLGFTDIGLTTGAGPVLCRDATRQFVWALLEERSAVTATEYAIRVDSLSEPVNLLRVTSPNRAVPRATQQRVSLPSAAITSSLPSRRYQTTMPPNTTQADPLPTDAELIEQLLELRRQLSSAERALVAIARQLRARRKQQQLMKSTLASLKQLQTLGV